MADDRREAEKPATYEAWRITYQSSEAAARAAFSACVTLRAALAIAERQRDEARERLDKLEKLENLEDQLLARERQLRDALAEVESFINGYGGSPDARAALATPAPAPQQGGG